MNLKATLTSLPQYILPHHPLSRAMGLLTHSRNKTWKNFFIRQIIRHYRVDMDEALHGDINAYPTFNHFFTRDIKPELRPIATQSNAIVSPADGKISQTGSLVKGQIIQAKGKNYSALELLGGDPKRAEPFMHGKFATIYLSPKDYHRVHMPVSGTLREMVHIPGRLFSVNAATAAAVPRLFARNERVVAIFDTEAGPMALVLVGAIFVASIETVWEGVITPPRGKEIRASQYPFNAPILARGAEMGRFNMGSTVIVLFGKDRIGWQDDLTAGNTIKMGEQIGYTL